LIDSITVSGLEHDPIFPSLASYSEKLRDAFSRYNHDITLYS